MPSERVQRRIAALLDEVDAAITAHDWQGVVEAASAVLSADADNEDAATFLSMARAALAEVPNATPPSVPAPAESSDAPAESGPLATEPESFAGGRYKVLRFLGEGGKKRVFLAHDALLDRDIAFSLIKTEGLDNTGRERIMREARAMGRLTNANIVSIYDIGEHIGPDGTRQPYLVQELMGGGDVEGLLEDADGPLALQQSLDIAIATSRGLEFAHAQGVVHRDLKPGNVWLTSGGEAKIGDLGLAVTLGQSRLTSHGMMVGTYQYMPPEQALGAESTPQADLYSLGAMLYEMVAGRTPFEGETPTAVISQHLNTQPVAPSWHTEHCPPDLEALILRLLEKEPDKRPSSATEVLAALRQVDPEGRSVSHSDSQANPLDRLARGVFVGREKELEQLHEALNGAMEGRGSVVMLVGEPGIGKTRTVQELETYARMRGAEVYWGRTHESAGMPAYWPWIQIGRTWGNSRDLNQIGNQAGTLNPELLRLFPELQTAAPAYAALAPAEQQDPATAQFLLFEAYTQFVRQQAQTTPWVIVLDDLHWADKPTLQLLQYLARELTNMPVLVIATYRDTDLVRTHPLSEVLAELNRESGFLRVNLRGLDRTEVASYLRQRATAKVADSLVSRVYEETEGNPFFLSEVVNLMTQEGTLTSDSISDVSLPDGVREALGRRLDRISDDTNELLRMAAVVGREFAYDILTLLDERSEDALLKSVEEALDARVIEELPEPGRYRFTHALMQETLLEELSTTRRVRIHGEVGEALERRWGEATAATRASRLARHFTESSTLTESHREKALKYSRLAAEAAEAQSAWSEAIRHLENGVSSAGEIAATRAKLLVDLGRVAQHASEWRVSWRSLMQALNEYRDIGDQVGFAQASYLATRVVAPRSRITSIIDEALERISGQDPLLEGLLLAQRLRLSPTLSESDQETMETRLSECEVLANDDRLTLAQLAWLIRKAGLQREFADALSFAERRFDLATRIGDAQATGDAYQARVSLTQRLSEDLGTLEELAGEWLNWATEANLKLFAGFARQTLCAVAWLRGDFAGFEEVRQLIPEDNFARDQWASFYFSAIGRHDDALSAMPSHDWPGGEGYQGLIAGGRARVLWFAGREADARLEFERAISLGLPTVIDARLFSQFEDAYRGLATTGEAVAHLGSFDDLDPESPGQIRFHAGTRDRTKAIIALAAGDIHTARESVTDALRWSVEQQAIIEQARCEQLLADIELAEGHRDAALPLLDSAAATYDRFGLRLYLDQVIAKKEILKA